MKIPATQRVRSDFLERNAFLYALLGALSYADRFQRMVGHELGQPGDQDAASADSDAVDALLGIIALNNRLGPQLQAWLRAQLAAVRAPASLSVRADDSSNSSLLR
jgi:hypothetical protein